MSWSTRTRHAADFEHLEAERLDLGEHSMQYRLVCECAYQERVFASPFRSQAWADIAGGGRC